MKKIVNFFKVHFLLGDTLVIVACFYLLFGVFNKFGRVYIDLLIFNNADRLYPVLVNSCITLLGFMFTGVSITMIFLKDNKLEPLKEYGHFQSILNIYFNTILVCAILTAISLCGMMIDKNIYLTHATALIMFLLVARLYRCVWVIKRITDILYQKPKQ